MDDEQREPRVADSSSEHSSGGSSDATSTAVTDRMLANPRRVRRA